MTIIRQMDNRVWITVGLLCIAGLPNSAAAGDITGQRVSGSGSGIHESLTWAVGAGNNPAGSHGTALSWFGNYSITNLPAGQYYVAGNAHGSAPHSILDTPVTVPASGSVTLNIQDPLITMGTDGLTDLGACRWAAQTFVATGRDLDEVVIISPDGGSQVSVSIREGGPTGPQIGPSRTITQGSLWPSGAHWGIGDVPLVPGRLYAVRLDALSPATWTPALGYRVNVYPNGHAWLDGMPIPEADLKMSIACRDTGFLDDYSVDNWWRSNRYHELVQTFIPQGEELRMAQMMLAGDGGYIFRASLHQWSGNYPPGPQVGFAKHATMSKDLPQAFIWGPGEAPLTPGQTYALRFIRADGGDFAIYGNSNDYSNGKAYFDGLPDNGIDMNGTFVTREVDRGEIAVSNLTFTPLSATEIRATFQTNVPTTATIASSIGSTPYDTIWPAANTQAYSHDIVIHHLAQNTTYPMRVVAYHPERNVLNDPVNAVPVTTLNETATFTGHVHSQTGPAAGAEIILEEPDLVTFAGPSGDFSFASAPTGRHTLKVQAVGFESVTQDVDVTADGLGFADLMVTEYGNLLAGSDANPIAGWTTYGAFDGEFSSGSWSIPARTGPKWMGYVANWPDMSPGDHGGGLYRTLDVEPGKPHRFGGFILTNAYGSDHDPIVGLAVARLGVDPTGGTNPSATSVVWSRFRFTSGAWLEQWIDFTPSSSSATLFVQHKWEYFYETPVWFIAGYEDLWLGARERPLPDFDQDGDIDLVDFGRFQVCYSGAGVAQPAAECLLARIDEDEDVDHDDFTIFEGCMSGADIPAEVECAAP
jgi:hypothetical protein